MHTLRGDINLFDSSSQAVQEWPTSDTKPTMLRMMAPTFQISMLVLRSTCKKIIIE